MNLQLCPDAVPNLLNFFDTSIAPPLLFYAYIPILILSLVFGFVVWKKGKDTASKYFLLITLSLATWIMLIMFQWMAIHIEIVNLAWQLLVIPEILIFLFSVFFCYSFLFKKGVPGFYKYIFILFYIGILILLPTTQNIIYFDLFNCEAAVGHLWSAVYILELIFIMAVLLIGIEKYIKSPLRRDKNIALLFSSALAFFLAIFWSSNYFAEITQTYEINLWGPLGIAIFLGILTYIIVHYKAFNIKLLAAEALVLGLVILIASELFFVENNTNKILVSTTLVLALIFGAQLVKSVAREVRQRELIEKQKKDLELANEGQATLIHFINHQIKGYLAKGRSIYAELLEDNEYGPLSQSAREIIKTGEDSLKEGVEFVQDILKASDIEKGTMTYNMEYIDFRKIVEEISEDQKKSAIDKNLQFEVNIVEADYEMRGDANQLKEAVRNIISNSISYTQKGSINISLSKEDNKILFKVKDTGVGLSEEVKPKLFTKGGRDKNSQKINVNSTGYGLSIVKGIVDAHHGKVWADSEGPGKGSTFTIELHVV